MFLRFALVIALAFLLAACDSTNNSPTTQPIKIDPSFDVFKPEPSKAFEIDYVYVDELLNAYVMVSGPSIRQRLPLPMRPTGSKSYYGHTSPYRLEGNKIRFSLFNDDAREAIIEYTDSLINIANEHDVSSFPAAEQLAFWFNLHNMLVIREISKTYPVRTPLKIEPNNDGVALHESKLVEIKGVALSLNDIRNNIVYRNWQNPMVFYGFYHGDLSSPSIRRNAYRPASLERDLAQNAFEYVTSLRGVSDSFGKLEVSPLYREAIGQLFPNWPEDFIAHLKAVSNDEIREIVSSHEEINFSDRETHITDLMGGERAPVHQILPGGGGPELAFNRANFMSEFYLKQDILIRRMERIGTITVEDLPDVLDSEGKNNKENTDESTNDMQP